MTHNNAAPVVVWLRRDLRLSDNPAIGAAYAGGGPIIFVFIKDQIVDGMGACPKWRLGASLADLSERIAALGNRLILRQGDALAQLSSILAETGAATLHYCRDYTPAAIKRDTEIKSELKSRGVDVQSHNGALLFEPWTVETKTGGYYKVYTPFWRAVRERDVPPSSKAPAALPAPAAFPASDTLDDWALGASMRCGADIVEKHTHVGEVAAEARLTEFCAHKIGDYKDRRDRMDEDATSGLSENLTYGEISPRRMWHAGQQGMLAGAAGAEHFLKELVWREFAYHLLFHSPHMLSENWRDGWDAFPWRDDNADAEAWRRGETGEPIVDAAMRELYVTGMMHNRSRMIVASYLTKHLMTHWRVGMAWFEECLTDWDPASNAMGWQWVAGCGPDASPFFRIFNPATQADKFDPQGEYRARFLNPANSEAASFYMAVPECWQSAPDTRPEIPMVELKAGRERALAAWKSYTSDGR